MHWNLGRRTAGLLIAAAAIAGPASAEVSASYTLDFASAYVWRGISVTDGAVFQPSITISHEGGFSFNTWGNLDITDDNDLESEFIEVDLTPSYTFPTEGKLGVTVGLIEYLFPNSGGFDDSTTEVFVSLGYDASFAPALSVYYDFDAVDDFYANLSFTFSHEISDSTSLSLALSAGYAGEDFSAAYVGGTDGGFFDGKALLSLGYSPEGKWGIAGYIAYSDSLDTDVLPDQEVDFFGGVSFSRSF